jgi:polar amino acid transport system substrate-binding protein
MMLHYTQLLLLFALLGAAGGSFAAAGPNCSRPMTLALHDHGLLYSTALDAGIDKDFAAELIKRSGCKVSVTLMTRARIWQLIESGALDFSLSGISNAEREKYAGFAWYFSNKYYLLVRKDANVRNLADFENNTNLQLGAIRSFRYSKNANRLVDKLHESGRISYSSGLDPLYQVLAMNRIQGMIIEPFDYSQVAGSGIRDLTDIVETGDAPVAHGLIMSNKSIPPAEQEKWRVLVNGMREDGTTLRIFKKYFEHDLASEMVDL